jgi:ribosomal protein S18 acetylase RimI-like enzyme
MNEGGMEFRVVGPGDQDLLTDLLSDIDRTFFRPHPFTADEVTRIAGRSGRDVYAMLLDHGRPVAYGLLRGWDEGYSTPSLGVAVRSDSRHKGFGRAMMAFLHAEVLARGSTRVRLRVHPDNSSARRLYESLSYSYEAEEGGELVMSLRLDDDRETPTHEADRT